MPSVTVDGATLQYELSGDRDRPTIAFVPDVGFGPWMWGWQAPKLSGPYQTLVYATRGTDGSDASPPYTVDRFAADLEAVLSAADVRRVHLVGAGLGGMVALRYGREYSRARTVTICGTPSSGSLVDEAALDKLHPTDLATLEASLSLGFTDRFLSETEVADQIVEWRRAEDATGETLSDHKAAALAFEAKPLYELTMPALVCHGIDDPVVSVDAGEALAENLPRGKFEPVEGKRCCYIEHAVAVSDAIDGFVQTVTSE